MDRKTEYIKQKEEATEWIRALIDSEKIKYQTNQEYFYKLCLDMYDIGYVDGFDHSQKEFKKS